MRSLSVGILFVAFIIGMSLMTYETMTSLNKFNAQMKAEAMR